MDFNNPSHPLNPINPISPLNPNSVIYQDSSQGTGGKEISGTAALMIGAVVLVSFALIGIAMYFDERRTSRKSR
jgi:hypothetical protein